MATKWGIASAGKISHDFVNALSTYGENGEHQVLAVAARNLKDAQDFAQKFGIPQAYKGTTFLVAWFTKTNNLSNSKIFRIRRARG